MRRLIAMFAFMCAVGAGNLHAQQNEPKKEKFSWQKEYQDEAGIPPEVQAKIEAIKDSSEIRLKTVRKDATLSEEAKKEKQKEINKAKFSAINALLSKEQKEKIKSIRERLNKDAEN